ncbi:MAG TPA: hypothetical protein VFC18_08350 [Burkholderiales bacterium]|nr:hypothetical protein [Burkholderiales bacterium]
MRRSLLAFTLAAWVAVAPAAARAQSLAPGFTHMSKDATVVIMPVDVELFSISAGGIAEPRADWTEAALGHFRRAAQAHKEKLGLRTVELSEAAADELAEVNALHAAVAGAIALHHFGYPKLPTKDGKLDWSLGDAVQPIRKATGARYAFFSWVRDSYASAERKAAMIGMALLGVGLAGGQQVGYVSLVDLETGRVVWFNRLARASGDLREAGPAAETVDALLRGFPVAK